MLLAVAHRRTLDLPSACFLAWWLFGQPDFMNCYLLVCMSTCLLAYLIACLDKIVAMPAISRIHDYLSPASISTILLSPSATCLLPASLPFFYRHQLPVSCQRQLPLCCQHRLISCQLQSPVSISTILLSSSTTSLLPASTTTLLSALVACQHHDQNAVLLSPSATSFLFGINLLSCQHRLPSPVSINNQSSASIDYPSPVGTSLLLALLAFFCHHQLVSCQ